MSAGGSSSPPAHSGRARRAAAGRPLAGAHGDKGSVALGVARARLPPAMRLLRGLRDLASLRAARATSAASPSWWRRRRTASGPSSSSTTTRRPTSARSRSSCARSPTAASPGRSSRRSEPTRPSRRTAGSTASCCGCSRRRRASRWSASAWSPPTTRTSSRLHKRIDASRMAKAMRAMKRDGLLVHGMFIALTEDTRDVIKRNGEYARKYVTSLQYLFETPLPGTKRTAQHAENGALLFAAVEDLALLRRHARRRSGRRRCPRRDAAPRGR